MTLVRPTIDLSARTERSLAMTVDTGAPGIRPSRTCPSCTATASRHYAGCPVLTKDDCIVCGVYMDPAHTTRCTTSKGDTCVGHAPMMYHILAGHDRTESIGITEVWSDGTVVHRLVDRCK